jgi:hypothetical protein
MPPRQPQLQTFYCPGTQNKQICAAFEALLYVQGRPWGLPPNTKRNLKLYLKCPFVLVPYKFDPKRHHLTNSFQLLHDKLFPFHGIFPLRTFLVISTSFHSILQTFSRIGSTHNTFFRTPLTPSQEGKRPIVNVILNR